MKLSLVKQTEITGSTRYKILGDGNVLFISIHEDEVKALFSTIIENSKKGYPLTEILAEEEINYDIQ